MPLQDKNRPGRKVTARKIVSSNGQIFDSAQHFAEEYDIAVQTAYNIIRRKQVFRGLTFRYMDDSEQTNTNRNETEVHNHD